MGQFYLCCHPQIIHLQFYHKEKYAKRRKCFKSPTCAKSNSRCLGGFRDFFHFNINQIIDMKRRRNGAEIKSMRPEDVLFLLFPCAKT